MAQKKPLRCSILNDFMVNVPEEIRTPGQRIRKNMLNMS